VMRWQGKKPLYTRDELNKIYKNMFTAQQRWLDQWKKIRDYINPYIGFFEGENPNDGNRSDDRMINTAPLMANNIQAAGMQDGMTSPFRPWFKTTVDGIDENDNDAGQWCDLTTEILLDIFARSNFYDSAIQFYKELGAPCTAVMWVDEDPEHVVWYRTFTIGEYAIGTTRHDKIDRFARRIQFTSKDMIDNFGEDNCPDTIKQTVIENKNYDTYEEVKHLIIPNPNYNPKSAVYWAKKFISLYWTEKAPADDYLKIEGFDEFPMAVSRWDTKGADIYGRGPGWYALSLSMSLQELEMDIRDGIARGVRPSVIAPVEMLERGGINSLPDGVNYYPRSEGAQPIQALYQVQLQLQEAEAKKQQIIQDINQHFFVDLFRMLEGMENTGQITAREIIERVQEKMSQIGPVLNRLQHEFLQPVIERTFNIALRNGIIPPPPDSIQGMNLKIEYVSNMAQAQKMQGLTAIQEGVQFATEMAEAFPDTLDIINGDETLKAYLKMLGTPAATINSQDQINQVRQAKQKQMQMQQAAQMGTAAAQGAKTLSDTPLGNGSALDAIMPGLGGFQGAG